MHFDQAFVIGFPDQKSERLDRFFESCQIAGIQVEIFPAVRGDSIDLIQWAQDGYLVSDFKMNMPGSLGCLLSHVTIWEKIYNDPDVNIALICEDDAILENDFLLKLNEISWDEVPDDWDVIRLACHKITGDSVSDHVMRPPTGYIKGANAGTYCYLVKAANAMKLKDILTPYDNRRSMDVMLKTRSDQYRLYVLKTPLADEQRFRYSLRKDMNLKHKNGGFFRHLANWITARWLR